VIERRRETARVTSYWLEPVEPEGWQPFQAGQFLSFRLPSADARGKMLRNYSLASAPHETGRYRICVKRENPSASSQGGQGSGFFHDHVQVGDVLHALGPRGNFVLKESADPALLISAGIGITPLVSMLAMLARRDQPTTFIHECESADDYMMHADVMALAQGKPHMRLQSCFTSEGAGLDAATLNSLLPTAPFEVYLCGPTPFMQRVYGLLRASGVPSERIAHEFFGPMVDLERAFRADDGP
ncbi:MAG: FAD-binding oxidoreductase, partial [Beijerinckiaceae bacterium]